MDFKEAKRRFQKADKLFMYGRFEDVMDELDLLETHFPNNHRLLNARARTLEQLRRYDEALGVCDRLLNDFDYEKVRPLRDTIVRELGRGRGAQPPPLPPGQTGAAPAPEPATKDGAAPPKTGRFRLKPLDLTLLVLLVALAIFGYLYYVSGAGR